MESEWIQALLDWITANPGWSSSIILLIAFIESLVVVGFLIPGIFILFGVGTLIGLGVAEIWPIWVAGSLGAFFGDILSYSLGHRYRLHLRRIWPFCRYPGMLQRGTDFFRRHGAKSVVAGRFIGPLRPVIPVTVGMLGMSPRRFLLTCIPACILWTPAYLLPGMLFGASLEVVAEYAGRLSLVLLVLVAGVWLGLWFIRTVYEILVAYSARWLRRAIRWSRRHPLLGRIVGPIIDPSQPEVLSVTMLGLLLVLTIWALFLVLFLSPFGARPPSADTVVLAWAQNLRNDIADPFMVSITQLSRWWVLVPTSTATLLWLLGAQRTSAAAHWLVAMAGGLVLHLLVSWTLKATPLIQAAGNERLYLPSAPMTMTTVVLGFFSVMVAKELHRRHRKWPYLASTLLLTLLVMARVYLGLDWLSGALVGLILGLAWTAIVGMAYRARALRPFSGAIASVIFYGTLTLTLVWQVAEHLDEDAATLRISLPEETMSVAAWWAGGWQALPTERTRAAGVAARNFNIQVVGPVGRIQRVFHDLGWETAEPAGWQWVLKALNPDANESSLPLTGKNFLGHGEVLVLRRRTDAVDTQWTLRLWDSGSRLEKTGAKLLVGQYSKEELVTWLRFFSYWEARPVTEGELAVLAESLDEYQVKMVRNDLLLMQPPGRPGQPSG